MSRNTPWRTTRKMYALRQGSNDWYRIRNQINGPTQLHIYDEIGYFGVSAGDLIRDLADITGPLEVHLNSPGGEVFDGIAIYNTLLARKDVTVMIDGLAASIASVIAMAGNPVLMARNAQMMVHEGFGMAIGCAQDMRDMAEILDRTSHQIAGVYSDHTGRPTSYWREVMKAETWYSADEAIEAGLADRLIDSGAGARVREVAAQDKWDLTAFRGAASVPYVSERQTRHEPMTGRHTHDHAAPPGQDDHDDGIHNHVHEHNNDADHFGHHATNYYDPDNTGDNDMSPDTDTDHSHWTVDGRQLQPVPGRPMMNGLPIDIMAAAVDNSPWDAAKAMREASSSSDPAAAFKAICAGRRDGPAGERGSWALPHHYKPGSAPNAHGVQAALGRLSATQGLTNTDAARSHLEAHMRAINPDYEPSNSASQFINPTDEEMDTFLRTLRGV